MARVNPVQRYVQRDDVCRRVLFVQTHPAHPGLAFVGGVEVRHIAVDDLRTPVLQPFGNVRPDAAETNEPIRLPVRV